MPLTKAEVHDRQEDDEHDDECGDGHDPGLGLDCLEQESEDDGDDRDEEGSGEDRIPETGRHVVECRDDDTDQHRDGICDEGGCDVPSLEAVHEKLDDHRDDQEDQQDAESVPGEGGQGEEHSGQYCVDVNRFAGLALGIHCLDHLDEEQGHERDEEGREGILGSTGEHGGGDGQSEERKDERCDDSCLLSVELLCNEEHGDAGEGTDDGVEHTDTG